MRTAALLLVALAAAASASEDCVIQRPDGMFVDLSPLNKNWLTQAFLLNPCGFLAVAPEMPEGNAICDTTTRACQLDTDTSLPFKAVARSYSAAVSGNTTIVTLENGDSCPNVSGQPNRKAIISFECGSAVGAPSFVGEVDCVYTFTWTSSAACPAGAPPGGSGGLSGGDWFLIIFFIGGFLYFAVGFAVMWIKYEYRGVEAVPNIEFWRGLPGLLRDGGRFTYEKVSGGCKRDSAL